MALWAYCTQSAGLRHRVHDPRPQIQPYLRVTSLRCPNTASLMEGWHPKGSNPLAPPSCGVYPAVPTCIPPARLVGRCLGTVLAGGPKLAKKTPEKQVPLLGAPCSAFLRVSHPLSLRILVGLPWWRPSPSICGHSPPQQFLALGSTPTPPWHCALPWCSRFTWSLRFWLPHLRRYALRLPLAHYSHHRPHPVQPPGWEVPLDTHTAPGSV